MEGLICTDIIWDANVFAAELKIPKGSPQITFGITTSESFSEKPSRPSKSFMDKKFYTKLCESKEKIPNCSKWDKWSRLCNPYDKVSYLAKSGREKNNRDYFKLYELIKFGSLAESNSADSSSADVKSLHICESPGGFIRATKHFLPKVKWHAQSLETIEFYDDLDRVHLNELAISYGDITKYETIKKLADTVGAVDIITADGSIDTSHDPSNQESLMLQLIFSEITCALNCQKVGGTFVMKIFDSFTRPTCQLLYYLLNYYSTVDIVKPRTSRYTNAEKYVVAKNFKGTTITELNSLKTMMQAWDNNYYCRTFGIDIPERVEKQIRDYNHKIIDIQCAYIEKAIVCSYDDDEILEKQIDAFQNKRAMDFCSVFGINTNLSTTTATGNCKHFKKTKMQIDSLKNVVICEKCLILLVK